MQDRVRVFQRWVLMFCLTTIPWAISAQDANEFLLNAGYTRLMLLDHLASPNVFDSNGVTLTAGYARNNARLTIYADLSGSFDSMYLHELGRVPLAFRWTEPSGEVLEDYGSLRYDLIGGGLTAGALLRIHGPGGRALPVDVGIGMNLKEILRYSFAQQWQGMINTASIQAELQCVFEVADGHELEGSISFPFASLVTRMPWSLDPVTPGIPDWIAYFMHGTRFATVNTFQHVQAGLSYKYSVNPGVSLVLEYAAAWLHYSLPRDITVITNNLSVGVEL
jgi:hypothetical protein